VLILVTDAYKKNEFMIAPPVLMGMIYQLSKLIHYVLGTNYLGDNDTPLVSGERSIPVQNDE
jgi:hypothetical protein